MSFVETIIQEFERESATTRRVLERVPSDKLTWKPHEKSMSVGELAMHVAWEPGVLSGYLPGGTVDFVKHGREPKPQSVAEILATHDKGVTNTIETLRKLGDAGLMQPFSATMKGAPYFTIPKVAFVRNAVLNHTYHHRGQLSVYLRLLDVPVPAIYGPSADEAPSGVHVEPAAARA